MWYLKFKNSFFLHYKCCIVNNESKLRHCYLVLKNLFVQMWILFAKRLVGFRIIYEGDKKHFINCIGVCFEDAVHWRNQLMHVKILRKHWM